MARKVTKACSSAGKRLAKEGTSRAGKQLQACTKGGKTAKRVRNEVKKLEDLSGYQGAGESPYVYQRRKNADNAHVAAAGKRITKEMKREKQRVTRANRVNQTL